VDTETEDRAVQAVARGAAHVAVCAYASTISQQARGTPLQSILLSMRAPQVVLGVSLKTLGQYRSPSDLRGRRVGVLTQVAGSSLVLGMLLQQADLRLADITLVPSEDPADLLARYRAGQIDALSVNDPLMTLLEQRSEVRVVADTRSLRGSRDVFGGLMPGCAVCALPEFVRGQPAACQAMVDGLVHALKWLQTAGPSDIIKAVPEPHFDGDRAVYLSALDKLREGFAADGLLAPEHALTALRALSRLDRDVRLERIQLARTYTNEFAQKAKARFRA
jgi:NitT/TauT family transport system substrate-binding protein